MNYQGQNPNAPRGQRSSGTGQQPTGTQPQQPPQQLTQQGQQPPYQVQQQQAQTRQPQTQPQQPQQTQPRQSRTQPQQRQAQPGGTRQQVTRAPGGTPTQQPQTQQQAGGISQTMPTTPQAQGMQQQAQQQMAPSRATFQPATVEELIVTDVVTAQRDTPIRTVVSSMAENDVGSVVILDDDGVTPIDIITDRKITLALEGRPNIAEQNVEELLTGDLIVGSTDMTVFDALGKLNEAKVRRLPIVDEDGALQGIVTLDDLLVFLGNQLSDALEVISAQSRR